ncbi:unnamed protein product [Paramecium sonneborni]|uniref:Tetratricopeptide repeat protein n=1 Tax=Paramecium sonneborni TaxID=65129 RepID=A0A8S1Q771_9CILI|nr:unnamed protein product [Paramecium sonneborni]
MQEQVIDLTKMNQGNVDTIINQIEINIQQRKLKYGDDDQKILKYNQILCKLLNQQALIALQVQNYEICLKYLKKAELITCFVPELKAQTLSNLACYYRKIGKTRTALQYLQQALGIELKNETVTTLPELYLNLCAVFSQLDRHEEAIQHIYLSIIMLQHELLLQFLKQNQLTSKDVIQKQNLYDQTNQQINNQQKDRLFEQIHLNKEQKERIQILIVAYHNLGVEMEHLKQSLESKNIFRSAYQLSQISLISNHPLRQTLGLIIQKYDNSDSKDNIESVNLKPILPKLNLRSYDYKQVYKSNSPKFIQKKRPQSLPKNKSNIGSKEDKRNISSEKTQMEVYKFIRINDLNEEYLQNLDNKDNIIYKELYITMDTGNQNTLM